MSNLDSIKNGSMDQMHRQIKSPILFLETLLEFLINCEVRGRRKGKENLWHDEQIGSHGAISISQLTMTTIELFTTNL